jgi:DNA-binding NarL/FixJ family response regulator
MFKKVLVVEDIDAINIGITSTLKDHFSFDIKVARYCDKAFLMVKKALQLNLPFDLLITDLSFSEDHVKTIIKTGEDLITMVKSIQPDIQVLIYSIEDRPFKIQQFIDRLDANGYVLKGRNSSRELVDAIYEIRNQKRYISPQIEYSLKKMPALEIDDYDLELIKELANGNSQHEICGLFEARGRNPSSLSSIEKRINKLKDYFMAKNTPHVVAIAKDMGLF